MKKAVKWMVYPLLIVVLLVIVLIPIGLYIAMPIGTGYAAKYLCSEVFIGDRDPDFIFNEEIAPTNFLFPLVNYEIDFENKTVQTDAFGFLDKIAYYREGFGCTLANGVTKEELMRQVQGSEPGFTNSNELEWPLGEKVDLTNVPPEINLEKIQEALEYAFDEPYEDMKRRTQAVVIVYNGKIIAEKYADYITAQTPLLGWSMTKSVTSSVIGLLVKDGKLNVMDRAPISEWDEDERSQITLNDLLHMSSGLEFEEQYLPFYDATNMLYEAQNMAEYAINKPLIHPPNTVFNYSSGTTNILMQIARETVGGELTDIHRYIMARLFKPLHMHTAVIEPDASGNYVGSSYMFASGRDWARFGLLFLNEGQWNGEQLIPQTYVEYCKTPVSFAPRRRYGGQFHLNAGEEGNLENRNLPSLPTDIFYCNGFNEQHVVIFPSNNLVVVRLGATQNKAAWDIETFLNMVYNSLL